MKLVKNGPLKKNISIYVEIMVPKRKLWKLKCKKTTLQCPPNTNS